MTHPPVPTDGTFLRRALELAERGRGFVEPNPLVGAVVVRDGRIVGEGYHERFGQAHAEVNALGRAGDLAKGATLYVTLEPCCHQGQTPPCTDAVIAAGVRRVVAAATDPSPHACGKGFERLRGAGIEVTTPLLEAEARRQNAPFFKLLTTGRPYVHAKWAMTLDGKLASASGDSKWISSEASRRTAHELRGRMDAILIGVGTALADDPLLTARPPGPRTAIRVILDSEARLPTTSRLVQSAKQVPVLVLTTRLAHPTNIDCLERSGCEVHIADSPPDSPRPSPFLSRVPLDFVLAELGRRRLTHLLVEGGANVLGSFLDAGAIDEVHVFLAPKLLGGAAAKTPAAGLGISRVADALRLDHTEVKTLERDLYIRGTVARRA